MIEQGSACHCRSQVCSIGQRDILSPKYAPDTTAPAVIASGNPRAVPTPISATPMEPAVDQDEPVASDTMEQRMTSRQQEYLRADNFDTVVHH